MDKGEGEAASHRRFLVLDDDDQVEPAQKLVGNRYYACTLRQAKNGLLRALDGKQVLCWPSPSVQSQERMRAFAMEITDLAAEVKYLDTSLPTGDVFTPAWIMSQATPWDFGTFKLWATGEASGVNFIQVITGSPDEPVPVSDAPGVQSPYLPDAQAMADGSVPVPPLHAAPSPEQSEFTKGTRHGRKTREIHSGMPGNVEKSTAAGTFGADQPSDSHQGQVPDMLQLAARGSKGMQGDDLPDLDISAISGEIDPASAAEEALASLESLENPHLAADRTILAADRPLTATQAYRPYQEPVNAPTWSEPTDFWAEIKVPEMREAWMPPALAEYFCQESETRGSDPGIMALYGLGICAGAISDSIRVRVKPDDPLWLEPGRLWIGICGNSGTMKSPSLNAVLRPLDELEQKLMLQAAAAIDRYNMDMDVYEQQRKNYVTAKVKGETGIIEPIRPERPCRNRLIVKNATLEALHDVLADQADRGILEVHDELSAVFTGANQYKKGGSDIEERLKLWDGGRHTIDRKNSLLSIKNWSSSIVGGTQPNKIRKIVGRMSLDDDGSIQRFNFYLARQARLDLERPAHHGHKEFTDIVERLYDLQCEGELEFSPQAHLIRRDLTEWIHNERGQKWIDDSLRSHISKYSNFFPRFCVVFHAIDAAANHNAYIPHQIPESTARRVASLLRDCLYVHAKAFYSEIIEGNSDIMEHVRLLAGKILAKAPETIDITWISHGWTKWRTFPDWIKRGILTVLSDSGWIYSDDKRGFFPGRPIKYAVNPALQSVFSVYADKERAYLEIMEQRRSNKMREPGED